VLTFAEPLKAGARVELSLLPSSVLAGQVIEVWVGDSKLDLQLPEVSREGMAALEFDNTMTSKTLVIKLPVDQPGAIALTMLRTLGY
jgi:hypothetical protein